MHLNMICLQCSMSQRAMSAICNDANDRKLPILTHQQYAVICSPTLCVYTIHQQLWCCTMNVHLCFPKQYSLILSKLYNLARTEIGWQGFEPRF